LTFDETTLRFIEKNAVQDNGPGLLLKSPKLKKGPSILLNTDTPFPNAD